MNYLELCQRARQEAGISGAGPTTVIDQTGVLLRVVDWVADAWIEVQNKRPNWLFMWEEFTFNTAAATRDYLAADVSITDLAFWDTGSFYIYETALGTLDQNPLPHSPYRYWRPLHRNRMDQRADDRPQLFTILPNNKVRMEPEPDDIYTIDGEYKRTNQLFAADADVPTNLPDDFHMIIVWQALKYYGFYENAPEVLDEAETNFDNLLFRLEAVQLPNMSEDYAGLA